MGARVGGAARGGAVLAVAVLAVAGLPAAPVGATAEQASTKRGVAAMAQAHPPGMPSHLAGEATLAPPLVAALGSETLDAAAALELTAGADPGRAASRTPAVGTTSLWPALHIRGGLPLVYLKPFTLRAVGEHVEGWVASGRDATSTGTAFPDGDCRNGVPGSVEVTDAQLTRVVRAFDRRIYPTETRIFSTPPERAGVATAPGIAGSGLNFAGDGDNTVALVDNIRDDNFYDVAHRPRYAGLYFPVLDAITDRNVVTIDAFDWLHGMGPNPEHAPDRDPCRNRPAAPYLVESVFAHEWQHLLQSHRDPLEPEWFFEGLAQLATTLVGYTDARRSVQHAGAHEYVYCFHGFGVVKGRANPNPAPCGGPQNSLTAWLDEGSGREMAADYGNAWSFMLFLYDRYGEDFVGALHRDARAQGLPGVQAQLEGRHPGTRIEDVVRDFQLMNLLDAHLDRRGATVTGIDRRRVTTPSLDAALNLADPATHARPGAAVNGADYILLAPAAKPPRELTFAGSDSLVYTPTGGEIHFFAPAGAVGAPAGQTWTLSVVGLDARRHRARVLSVEGFRVFLGAAELASFDGYPVVVAVISHVNPAVDGARGQRYSAYTLTVNGSLRPGGAGG